MSKKKLKSSSLLYQQQQLLSLYMPCLHIGSDSEAL